jgi:hypothetical protein
MVYVFLIHTIFFLCGASSFLTRIVLRSFIEVIGVMWLWKMLDKPVS